MEKATESGLESRFAAAAEIERLARSYARPGPRESLAAVERLRGLLPLRRVPPAVVVVGTNGKTSTATYLSRLLAAGGRRTGLYSSPHLSEWGERVRIEGRSLATPELLEALRAVVELAGPPGVADLRFFDLLTLAAEQISARAEVDVAVFEAGIGGRLDAVATLEPQVVLLTGVALDHTEILGDSEAEILREKLLVAPPGAAVAALPIGGELRRTASEIAGERRLSIRWVDPGGRREQRLAPELPVALHRSLCLAEAGQRLVEEAIRPAAHRRGAPAGCLDLSLPGRFECGRWEGVPYVLDVAHNQAAWRELAAEMSRRRPDLGEGGLVVLFSVSPGKRRDELAAILRSLPGFAGAIVTRHMARPAADPREVAAELAAAGLAVRMVESSADAVASAFASARALNGRVLAFGSAHLVGELRRHLGLDLQL